MRMAGRSYWPPTMSPGRRSTIKPSAIWPRTPTCWSTTRSTLPSNWRGKRKAGDIAPGWKGVRIAQECNVKNLILFHHDPDSDDAYVDGLVMRARQEFPDTWGANEGLDHLPSPVATFPIPCRLAAESAGSIADIMWSCRCASRGVMRTANRARPMGWRGIFPGPAFSLSFPRRFSASEPVQLELVLPDEITHRGEMRVKFVARPVRQEIVGDGLREETPGVAVAAALELTDRCPTRHSRQFPIRAKLAQSPRFWRARLTPSY